MSPKAVTACGPFWGSSYELLCESVVPASLEHWRRLCGPWGVAMSNDDAFSPFVESPQRAVAGLEKRTAGTRCRVQKLRKSLFFFFSFSPCVSGSLHELFALANVRMVNPVFSFLKSDAVLGRGGVLVMRCLICLPCNLPFCRAKCFSKSGLFF